MKLLRAALPGLLAALLSLSLLLSLQPAGAAPTGATLSYNKTETVSPAAAGSSTTAGGSFTTLVLNATTQTPRWKAYVGNVTGKFTLRNANNYTIYDWGSLSSVSGEVYASRSQSPSWSSIQCVSGGAITAEESALNISGASVDSINNTFNGTVHRSFWVGTKKISASTCRAIATYVNSTAQNTGENASFQEVLLMDGSQNLIFTALIDDDTLGYDLDTYDFQMIVPESEYATTPHTYYFWLELG